MNEKQAFNAIKVKHLKMLNQYVPVVARVHGKTHPEFHDVHTLFNALSKKVQESGTKVPELNEEFVKLREITSNYTVPTDVCESYEAVYNMLAELDKAYYI